MTYTGYIDALHNGVTTPIILDDVLAHLDQEAELHGTTYSGAAIKRARQALERANELHAVFTARAERDRQAAIHTGRDYLDGKATAESVVDAAVAAVPLLVEGGTPAARRLVDQAVAAVKAEGVAALKTITEETWLKPIRTVVNQRIAAANADADAVGINAPRPVTVGARIAADAWAPTRADLEDSTTLRHAWERFEESLAALDEAMQLPDYLRSIGLLPTVPGRDTREDYRWLRVDLLRGRPSLTREFWLSNREHGQPGIYTSAEMIAADDGQTDSMHTDADLAESTARV